MAINIFLVYEEFLGFRVVWFYGISQFPLSTLINLCLDRTNSEFTEKWVRSEFSSQNRSCHALKYPQCFMMKYFKHEVLGGVLEQASRHYQPQPSPHKSAGFIVSFYHHPFIHPFDFFLTSQCVADSLTPVLKPFGVDTYSVTVYSVYS